jgi:SAM-dependent methyltransferase
MPAYLWAIKYEIEQDSAFEKLVSERDRSIADYLNNEPIKKLHIGAGSNCLAGWLNSDLLPETPDVIFIDATKRLPFADCTFNYVYTEHMIEHVPYPSALMIFREAHRILLPGGKLRVSTPDAEKIVRLLYPQKSAQEQEYIACSAGDLMGLYKPEKSILQQKRPEWDIDPEYIRRFYPDIRVDPAPFVVNNFFRSFGHQFIHTGQTIRTLFEAAGFTQIFQYSPGVSDDDQLRGLESHGALIGESINHFESMVFEATKDGDCLATD